MARNLTAMIEPMNPVRWFPMNETADDGDFAETIQDASANEIDLEATNVTPDTPVWDLALVNGRKGIYTADNAPVASDETVSIGHLFVIAKYNGANFGAQYRGLVTAESGGYILIGNTGGTTFLDPTPLDVTYYKSRTEIAQTGMTAPFTAFELLEIYSSGWSLDGFQLGQDRGNVSWRWDGWVIEPLAFSAQLTENQRKRVNLYYDLKYGFWKQSGVVQHELDFPSFALFPELPYARYYKIPIDWSAFTVKHTYDDETASLIDTTDNPPQEWEIEWTGLTKDEAEIFDAFNDAVRRKHTFNFIDKDGTEYTGVRLVEYSRTHEGNIAWSNQVSVRLVKYDS